MKQKLTWMGVLLSVGLAVALVLTAGVRAADRNEEALDPMQAAAAKVEMAERLAEFGRNNNDPSSLVTAGILLLQVPKARPLTEKPTATGDGAKDAKTEALPNFKEMADELFREALKRADKAAAQRVGQMIETAKKEIPIPADGEKALDGGPKTIRRNLPKGVLDTWQFAFEKGQPAYISVKGDKKLHIEVIRPGGEHVCDVNFTSAAVNFTPPNGFKWTIKVTNISNGNNAYTLTVN